MIKRRGKILISGFSNSGKSTLINTFLRKKISLEEVKEKVLIRTRQYAKRQHTWQRGQMKDWKGFNDTNYLDLRKKILSYLSKT